MYKSTKGMSGTRGHNSSQSESDARPFVELSEMGGDAERVEVGLSADIQIAQNNSVDSNRLDKDRDYDSDDVNSDGFYDARSRGGTLVSPEDSPVIGERKWHWTNPFSRTWRFKNEPALQGNRKASGNRQDQPDSKNSLCLHTSHPLRLFAFRVIDNHWFKRSILLLIIVNSIILALWEPTKSLYSIPSARNNVVDNSELVFQIIYTVEAVLKVVALGLVSRSDSYLRNGWDIMDFTIVTLGWVGMGLDSNSSLSGFRVVRMLRPLRTIRSLPGLRVLVLALLRALPQLLIVGMLLIFTLLVFGIMGVSLFQGNLRQHCVNLETGMWEETDRLCGVNGAGRGCPTGYSCLREFNGTEFENPAFGLIGFDNVAQASLTLFQCITLEGWTDVMYQVRDTTNEWTQLYFILLVIFGSFFILNLIVAVVTVNYSIERRAESEKAGDAAQLEAVVRNARLRKQQERRFTRKGGKKHALATTQMRLMVSYELHHHEEDYKSVTPQMYEEFQRLNHKHYPWWKQKYLFRQELMSHVANSPRHGMDQQQQSGRMQERPQNVELQEQNKNAKTREQTNNAGRGAGSHAGQETEFAAVEPPDGAEKADALRVETEEEEENSQTESSEQDAMDDLDISESGVEDPVANADGFQTQQEPVGGLATSPTSPRSFVTSHQTLEAAQEQLDRGDVNGAIELTKTALKKLQIAQEDQKIFGIGITRNVMPVLRNGVGSLRSLVSFERVSFPGNPQVTRDTAYPPIPTLVGSSGNDGNGTLDLQPARSGTERPGAVAEGLVSNSLVVQWCYKVTNLTLFQSLVVVMILLNTATLSAEHFGQPYWMFTFLDVSNTVFLAFFALEMVIKMIGLGWTVYFHSLFNTFDCVVVFSGLIEIIFKDSSAFSSLRVFRLLRVFKLARQWKSLNRLLKHMGMTITKIAPFACVLFIVLYIFTVSGMHLFGGLFTIPEHLSNGVVNPTFDCTPLAGNFFLANNVTHCPNRVNYDSFLWAFITTFQAMTGENWNEIMYLAVEHTSTWSILYYLAIVVIGSFIVLNLFLAVLIDTFVEKQQESSGEAANSTFDESKAEENMETVLDRQRRQIQQSRWGLEDHPAFRVASLGLIPNTSPVRQLGFHIVRSKVFNGFVLFIILVSSVALVVDSPQLQQQAAAGDEAAVLWVHALGYVDTAVTVVFLLEALLKIAVYGFVQHDGSYLRDGWNVLDFVIVVISVMGVAAASQELGAFKAFRALRALRPLRLIQRFAGLRVVLFALGRAVIPCLQVLAMCMLFYLVLAIVSVSLFGGKLHACFSAVTDAQLEAAAAVPPADVLNATAFLQTQWAHNRSTGAEQLYWQRNNHATWWRVTDESTALVSANVDLTGRCFPYPHYGIQSCAPWAQCVGVVPPVPHPDSGERLSLPQRPLFRSWRNPSYSDVRGASSSYSFDNVLSASLTLFEVSTMELWFQPMYDTTDITSTGQQPVRGSNDYASLFFLFFVLFSNFFLLQLFVTVMIDVFQQTQQELTGAAFLTDEQRQWVDMHKRVIILKAGKKFKPTTYIRRLCFNIAENKTFKSVVLVVITANTAILATEHYNQPDWLTVMITVTDFVFGIVYIFEFIIKVVAYGRRYFKSYRNLFDFVVVVCVIVGMANTLLPRSSWGQSEAGGIVKAIEALRVIRILRLSHYVPGLKDYLSTLFLSLPSLGNIGGILFLVYFVFAVAGMGLFGDIEFEMPEKEFDFLNDYAAFHNFQDALVTLFRMSTGESWNGLMHELQLLDPVSATVFCVCFVLLVQFAMVNLFVAVILNNFELEITRETIDERSLGIYRRTWTRLVRREAKVLRALLEDKYHRGTSVASDAARASGGHPSPGPSRSRRRQRSRIIRHMTKKLIDPMYLPASAFTNLFKRLQPPLGFAGAERFTEAEMMRIVRIALVPVTRTGYIQYNSTLLALIDLKQKWNNPDGKQMSQTLKQMALALNMSDDQLDYLHAVESSHAETYTLAEYLAAEKLQQHWRSWLEAKAMGDDSVIRPGLREQARKAVNAFRTVSRQPSDLTASYHSLSGLREASDGNLGGSQERSKGTAKESAVRRGDSRFARPVSNREVDATSQRKEEENMLKLV